MQRIKTGLLALAIVGGLSLGWIAPAKSTAADQSNTPQLTIVVTSKTSDNIAGAKINSKMAKAEPKAEAMPMAKQSQKQTEPMPEPKSNAKTSKNDSRTINKMAKNDSKTPTKTLSK